jgi:hypothetical protein
VTPFSTATSDLQPLGFTVLPLIPANAPHGAKGKAPGEFKANHWSGMSRWQRFRDVGPDAFTLGLWNRWPDANAGIVLGTHAGDDTYVVALDFDASDPDVLDDLLRVAPASSMVKRGQKGETRFYRAAKSLRSKPYDGPDGRLLDVLTGYDTRQTVVPPSIHPATGQPYVWLRGPVPVTDLPVLTEADMEALEEALEGAGWVRGGRRADRPVTAGPVEIDDSDPFSVAKSAALANLNKWVPALDLYDLRPARGGYEAVATWRPSSSGRPLEQRKRNLSIQANGIKDFGTNETYSAIDLVMVALDLDEGDALLWLEERLGLIADVVIDLGAGSTAGREKGASRERTADPQEPLGRSEASIAGSSHRPTHDREVPDYLLYPPGLLGEITDFVEASARRPNRAFALAAALLVIGTAAGRRIAGPTMSGTHLYVLGLADTGSGKDHALDAVATLLNAAGLEQHIGRGEFMSQQAVYRDLMRQPLSLCPMDEFGAFLAKVNNPKGSASERAISQVLRTAWGKSFSTLPAPGWATMTSENIHAPALSLFGASTDREFYSAINGGDVDNGFLNRFLLISTKRRPQARAPIVSRHEVPEGIVRGLRRIYSVGGPIAGATLHGSGPHAPLAEVAWADQTTAQRYDRFENEMVDRAEADPLFARTAEMAVRLATIRALGLSEPMSATIDLEGLEWARELCLWSAERMSAEVAEHMAETPYQAEVKRIHRIVRERGRITHRDLQRAINSRIRTKELEAIVRGLAESGMIRMHQVQPQGGGRRSYMYEYVEG